MSTRATFIVAALVAAQLVGCGFKKGRIEGTIEYIDSRWDPEGPSGPVPNLVVHVVPGSEARRREILSSYEPVVARGIPGAAEWDREVSELRYARKWDQLCEKVMDPRAAREGRASAEPSDADTCSMCGEFCAFKILDDTSV